MFLHVEESVLRLAYLKHSNNNNSLYFVNLMFSWAGPNGQAAKGLGLMDVCLFWVLCVFR